MTEDGGENRGTWVAHRGAAIVLRTIIFLIPVVLSVLGTAIISRALPPPSSTAVLILWWVLLSIAATSILYMTDKVARQLLPLHALLNLSLIFPDRAPSHRAFANSSDASPTSRPTASGTARQKPPRRSSN